MKLYRVILTADERAELEAITKRGIRAPQMVINALMLLNCDEGAHQQCRMKNEDVAAVLKTSTRKIDRIKKRFVEQGLEAALGRRPTTRVYDKKADGDVEAHLVALSCSTPPKGFSRWTLRLLADRAVELHYVDSISHETVRRVLKKTKLSRGKASVG
jgi:hypothetical protein